ncbi:uncharacterized protein LOC115454627 [Manduca sexta]|uniref:uncharacterized protein LOC115454627 n=1 Tax=Manduca sexta TaxID=7130 RepID=UPI00188E9339|nr:uncharacterized protein LOC115454627 [Manduca sexta]
MLQHLTQLLLIFAILQSIHSTEEGYLRFVKDGCFLRGEALSCVKYRALKIAKQTIFEDYQNSTINATQMISLVPLDEETIKELSLKEHAQLFSNEPKSFLSEWAELAKYFMKLVQDFFKMKGLRVALPDGARTVEDEVNDDARGKKKKLAIIIPLLTLLATMKIKFMLIPVLLAVMLIKKLLLIAALLLPSLLSTLKACKHHHPMTHYSYFGGSDSSDYNSDYSNSYSYSSGGGKDWAANRAYSMPKNRHSPTPMYVTAPGSIA